MYILYASSVRLINTEVRVFSSQHFIFVELLKLQRFKCQRENKNVYVTCLITSVTDKRSMVHISARSL